MSIVANETFYTGNIQLTLPYFCGVKKYLKYLAYFTFWLFYFIVTRVLFLVYHYALTSGLTGGEIVNSFLYGLRMDASFTAYICIVPFFLLLVQAVFYKFKIKKAISFYTIAVIIILSFITTADLELYTAWGYRMDATPLQYLKSPEEMGGTISSAPLFSLLLIFVLLTALFTWLYRLLVNGFFAEPDKKENIFLRAGIALLLFVFLFVPVRGGIQKFLSIKVTLTFHQIYLPIMRQLIYHGT